MKKKISITDFKKTTTEFSRYFSFQKIPNLYGVTDGKAVGTFVEKEFKTYLDAIFDIDINSVSKGIDLPGLNVDIKVSSIKQPQSSCPFDSAKQKIYGLGYSIIIFIYLKSDDADTRSSRIKILHSIYIDKDKTADYQITTGLKSIIKNNGNQDDIEAFLLEKMLPTDDIGLKQIAQDILKNPPNVGYLTISNALQWRLQYSRVIDYAGKESGIEKLYEDKE